MKLSKIFIMKGEEPCLQQLTGAPITAPGELVVIDPNEYESAQDLVSHVIEMAAEWEEWMFISEDVYNKVLKNMFPPGFINANLRIDWGRITSYDHDTVITKSNDLTLTYPYVIDIADNTYCYSNEMERNHDYFLLKNTLPQFNYKP